MAEALRCAECAKTFTPKAELLERFPGWQPKQCPACYRKARGGSSRPARSGSARAKSKSSGRSGSGREQLLTLEQVLSKYTDGPDTGVFTDGSAIPTPGPGGWGAVYVDAGEVIAHDYGHEADTTNNRMELRAVGAAFDLVPVGTAATIYSDSNLAVRTLTEWAPGWEKRGWKRRTGPVENLDLVQGLFERLRQRPELDLVWIRAHVGNRWNEYADSLATAWARAEL